MHNEGWAEPGTSHSYRRETRGCGHGYRWEGRCAGELTFVQVLFRLFLFSQ